MFCLRHAAVLKNPTNLAPIHSIYQSFTEAREARDKIYHTTGEILSITSYD